MKFGLGFESKPAFPVRPLRVDWGHRLKRARRRWDSLATASTTHRQGTAADVGILVDSTTDVANAAADIVLLERDLGVLPYTSASIGDRDAGFGKWPPRSDTLVVGHAFIASPSFMVPSALAIGRSYGASSFDIAAEAQRS